MTRKALLCTMARILPDLSSRHSHTVPPIKRSPTYHTNEVDAQEHLAGGLQGTASGLSTVQLPSPAGQHQKTANDGNCA